MGVRTENSGLPCKQPGCRGRTWVYQNPAEGRTLSDANGAFIKRTVICECCGHRYNSFERIEGEGWPGVLPKRITRHKIGIAADDKSPCLPFSDG